MHPYTPLREQHKLQVIILQISLLSLSAWTIEKGIHTNLWFPQICYWQGKLFQLPLVSLETYSASL